MNMSSVVRKCEVPFRDSVSAAKCIAAAMAMPSKCRAKAVMAAYAKYGPLLESEYRWSSRGECIRFTWTCESAQDFRSACKDLGDREILALNEGIGPRWVSAQHLGRLLILAGKDFSAEQAKESQLEIEDSGVIESRQISPEAQSALQALKGRILEGNGQGKARASVTVHLAPQVLDAAREYLECSDGYAPKAMPDLLALALIHYLEPDPQCSYRDYSEACKKIDDLEATVGLLRDRIAEMKHESSESARNKAEELQRLKEHFQARADETSEKFEAWESASQDLAQEFWETAKKVLAQ